MAGAAPSADSVDAGDVQLEGVSKDGSSEETGEGEAGGASSSAKAGGDAAPDRKAKIIFPIAGKVPGLTSMMKPVIEIKDLSYSYSPEKGNVLKGRLS